jgi:two-component system phosphate regulon sensor histidine kinase PhoR
MLMKLSKPFNLLILCSFIVALGNSIIFFLIINICNARIPIAGYAIFLIISWFIAFFVFKYILEKYLFEKIKVIYKTIQTVKVPKKDKNKKIDLKENIFDRITMDVSSWEQRHQQELEELKKMEVYRREFLGNVSHELKTPLFNLQGFILTLLDGAINDPEVNRSYLEKSAKNIERMINIVKDLEIIAQLESGEIKMNFSRFDIISLTREIFDLLEFKAKKKNITLTLHEQHSDNLPVWVFADRERIRQVLNNLIENSINYGNENGRTKVSCYDMNNLILIEVSDNGIGIDEKDLPHLFERFYRVDKSRSRNSGGSGLGLAIVKHIIESHQQVINVRSAPGVGSTFSFTLQKGMK